MATKQVQFYKPVCVHNDGKREDWKPSFWRTAHATIKGLTEKDRQVSHNGAPFYGDAGTGGARAVNYIRVGRVRKQADFPDTLDATGAVAPLTLQGLDLFETAYLRPFGTGTNFAFMGPIRGVVSTSAVESWLNAVLGLATTATSVELVPLVDPKLEAKLRSALGVSRLTVSLPKGTAFDGGRNDVEQAVERALGAATDQLNVEMTFSFGHDRPTAGMSQTLLNAARSLRGKGAKKLDVGLMLPNPDGSDTFVVEGHDLIRDRVAFTVTLNVNDGSRPDPDTILDGIAEAITRYNSL